MPLFRQIDEAPAFNPVTEKIEQLAASIMLEARQALAEIKRRQATDRSWPVV